MKAVNISQKHYRLKFCHYKNQEDQEEYRFRPVSVPIIAELKKYICGLNAKKEKIFNDNFSRYRWTRIHQKLGLEDYTFHDLRKTFGSILAQRGVSTTVIQNLLEHSLPILTNKVCTNVDTVLRHAVDQTPVDDWLQSTLNTDTSYNIMDTDSRSILRCFL